VAVNISFPDDGRGVEIMATGVVLGSEIIAANREMYEENRLKAQRYQIVDKSRCTEYSVTADEIAAIADMDKAASLVNPNIVIAVIESRELQFSLTELWQAHLRKCPFLTRSFRNRDAADAWIAVNADLA